MAKSAAKSPKKGAKPAKPEIKKKPTAKVAKASSVKSGSKASTKGAAAKTTAPKKAAAKAPAKAAAKPAVKAAKVAKPVKASAKEAPKKAVKALAPKKVEVSAEKESKKNLKAAAPAKVEKAPVKAAPEKELKGKKALAASKTKGKPARKEEEEIDDVFLDDDLGDSEITEYEEELAIVEEIDEVEDLSLEELIAKGDDKDSEEIVLLDAEGRRYCRARDCDQAAMVETYCRYHYLLFWRKIQNRKKILLDGKLDRYIEELMTRYPDKFLEMIRRDLRTEKDFLGAIQEMEIDEGANDNDFEEDTTAFIEEVRGMGEGTGSSVEDDDF